jgi:hypothetical protein
VVSWLGAVAPAGGRVTVGGALSGGRVTRVPAGRFTRGVVAAGAFAVSCARSNPGDAAMSSASAR